MKPKECCFFSPNIFFFTFLKYFYSQWVWVVVRRELHQLTPKFKDKTENLRRRHRRHTGFFEQMNFCGSHYKVLTLEPHQRPTTSYFWVG